MPRASVNSPVVPHRVMSNRRRRSRWPHVRSASAMGPWGVAPRGMIRSRSSTISSSSTGSAKTKRSTAVHTSAAGVCTRRDVVGPAIVTARRLVNRSTGSRWTPSTSPVATITRRRRCTSGGRRSSGARLSANAASWSIATVGLRSTACAPASLPRRNSGSRSAASVPAAASSSTKSRMLPTRGTVGVEHTTPILFLSSPPRDGFPLFDQNKAWATGTQPRAASARRSSSPTRSAGGRA